MCIRDSACVVDRDFIINSVLQGTVERMDGTISSALTAWTPELTGTLAECQDLDTVGNGKRPFLSYKMLVGQQTIGEVTLVMTPERFHQQELKVLMVKFLHQIC